MGAGIEVRRATEEVGRENRAALRTYTRLGMEHVDDGRILYRKLLPAGEPT